MKKFLIVLFVFFTFHGFAQIGFQAGSTVSSVTIEDNSNGSSVKRTTSYKVGFTAGLHIDVPVSDMFLFQPQLNFTQKGGKVNGVESGIAVNGKATYNFLELPVNFIFRPTENLFIGAGPALAYGISGREIYTFTTPTTPPQTISSDKKVKFGNNANSDNYKPFEISGNVLAGYTLSNGLFFAASYTHGFSNLSLKSTQSYKSRYFGFRIGFTLGGNND